MVRKKSPAKKAKIIGPGTNSEKTDDVFNEIKGTRLKKIIATTLLVELIGFVMYALWPFMNAFLGAMIIYFLTRPIQKWLIKKNISPTVSAGIILILVLLFITIPLFFGTKIIINEISSMRINEETIDQALGFVEKIAPSFDVGNFVQEQITSISQTIKNAAISMINNIAKVLINWVLFFFVLFYLLLYDKKISNKSQYLLPFSVKNRQKLFEEFKQITNSTVIATGAIGVIQGILIGLGFFLVGLPNPVLWGFITMIFSMLPVIGITFVWIPATAYLAFITHNIPLAIIIGLIGLFTSNIDYIFLRPWIQQKVGKLHPLITLLGIFMGIPIFGILGLIIGPLLLSLVVTMTKIYLEENI